MSSFRIFALLAVLLLLGGCAQSYNSGYDADRPYTARDADSAKLDSATAVIQEIMATPDWGIPANLLRKAKGIAVIPGFLKAGFIAGADYGRGVLVRKLPNGSWSDPSFITLAGGNFGFQIGAESTDLVLVFRTARSLDALEYGKLLLGGTASVAAGPVGRTAAAQTDVTFRSEVISYARSRGAFIGVALDGAALTMDYAANRNFYGVDDPLMLRASYQPATARRFTCTLAFYTGGSMRYCA